MEKAYEKWTPVAKEAVEEKQEKETEQRESKRGREGVTYIERC